MCAGVLQHGLLQGRLPGRKDFILYYLELTASEFHIFDGQDTDIRKHIQSIRIDQSDTAGVETKVRKGEFRFYLNRPGDGKYVFKVSTEADRERWIGNLQRVITKDGLERIEGIQTPPRNVFSPESIGSKMSLPMRVEPPSAPKTMTSKSGDSRTLPSRGRMASGGSRSVLNTQLPPPPTAPHASGIDSPRASIISTDSGIGTSVGGEVHRPQMRRNGSSSMPNSGSGMFDRGGTSSGHHSADAEFRHRVAVSDEDQPKWFWGTLSRQDCEDRLKEKGEIGNFVVRVNATGHHIMSFWRADGVHHHKILHHEGIWRFEKAAVSAEGESLADLLDTYMKNCTKDKNIKPFGGGLFENYTYAWAPQEFDMDLLGKKLKQQKELREKAARKPRKRQEYTPVQVDTGLDDEKGGFENDPEPVEETAIKVKPRNKPLPAPPAKPSGPPVAGKSSSIKQRHSSKSPADWASNSDSLKSSNKPVAPGVALMQELAKKKQIKSDNDASSGAKNKPLPPHPSSPEQPSEAVGESEPMYANTFTADTSYENCEFNGPPASSGTTPTAGDTTTTQTAGGGQSEYQNFSFGAPKPVPKSSGPQTKKKPKSSLSKSPNVAAKSHTLSSTGSAHVNGSVAGNSAGEYQNFQFGVQKK